MHVEGLELSAELDGAAFWMFEGVVVETKNS